MSEVLQKRILRCGRPLALACDGRCDKAWGINGRPRHYFVDADDDPDDYVYVEDDALDTAPLPGHTVGVSEGGDCKPANWLIRDQERMNRWCERECERSVMVDLGEEVQLRDMNDPRPNCAHRSIEEARAVAAARKAMR